MRDTNVPIISLLTDFGDRDEYVGVMKGVILSHAPKAVIVDVCHHISPHDIRQAAAMVAAVFPYFPTGTLHVVVVDPGVGSERNIVLARARKCDYLCPDNGLLTELILQGVFHAARRVTNQAFFADTVGATFHGRDIMAPVAGFLASGGVPEKLGPAQAIDELICLDPMTSRSDGQGDLLGAVVAVDRFGNIITNIGRDLLTSAGEGDLKQFLIIETGTVHRMPLVSSYWAVPAGQLLATIGSRGTLEIAVNQGNAADRLGIAPGASVRVARKKDPNDPIPGIAMGTEPGSGA
jgi:S-adenosyl-L-methionine hydrolase (adenosine-forming)